MIILVQVIAHASDTTLCLCVGCSGYIILKALLVWELMLLCKVVVDTVIC